ncbi:cupin domain-containing protein [Streptosporangium saharense]|uniref:Oxalate decarboxylase/phosphoglucose isomerase-like protein (Cupin superfamily) n=1 Tax=Streptosporangium saharense TaxID=1706840 RepID=A0A7W7VPG4_9ACTN|nr:cupin domain-containing protein [Streptosporangium saharense]MBB4917653.1 oxalate decarboxylase/phosphoglucose isomerase-like protein (cupin superfamily) [Streptosporangium saharense]
MCLYDGERWTEATGGDFLHVPEGGVHAFRNESGEDASMLILFAPGAPREPYFEDLPTLAGMSEEERAEFYLSRVRRGHPQRFLASSSV